MHYTEALHVVSFYLTPYRKSKGRQFDAWCLFASLKTERNKDKCCTWGWVHVTRSTVGREIGKYAGRSLRCLVIRKLDLDLQSVGRVFFPPTPLGIEGRRDRLCDRDSMFLSWRLQGGTHQNLSIAMLLLVCLVGFLTSSTTTKLYRGRVPRLTSDNFTCCHTRDRARRPWLLVSAGHIILTPTQPVGSGRPQRESNLGPHHQVSSALPTELPHPPPPDVVDTHFIFVLHC